MFMDKTIDKKLINYGEALYEACSQEMQIDPNVFVYGLGVDDPKGHYGTTKDLHKKFGSKRCFDTPLSEDAMTGIGIGSALAGLGRAGCRYRFLWIFMDFQGRPGGRPKS